ncbi:hypothetical protein PRA75_27115, partial [Klebsiella pneumoniae]|nr:hypothetical protein [Klebsiella pneumoniae]
KRAYCLKTQPATGETYPKSDLFNKAGIEVMRALRKGQASAFYYGDPLGEMRLVSRVFEM